jgi:hypothetical protein
VAAGSGKGKITTVVSWKDCITQLGIESIDIRLTIQPLDNTQPTYTKSKSITPLPGQPFNPNGSLPYEFTNLTSDDVVIKVEVAVFQKQPPPPPGTTLDNNLAIATGDKANISVPIPK